MSDPRRADLALLAVDFPPATGGIQTLTREIYSRLADLARVVVAPALSPGDPEIAGLPLLRTRHGSAQGWRTLLFLRDAVALLVRRRQAPLLLHCNHLFAGYAGWWLRRRFGLPYVVWIHGEELGKLRHPRLARASLAGASAILTNSEFTADLVRGHLPRRGAPPIHQIPLGAPSAWLAAPLPLRSAAARVPMILTVARLSQRDRYKGVDTALRACALLRQRGIPFRYRIAGDGDDRECLDALAASLELGAQVEFLGRVPDADLMALYDSCDVFLLCSREQSTPRGLGFEGFGIVFLEANARGKPVVGGRSGGVPSAVADGESGLLVDPLSPLAVADALELLLRDPNRRAALGAAGRARVQSRFNWDAAAAQVRALHRELLP